MQSDIGLIVWVIFILYIYSPSIRYIRLYHLSEVFETVDLLEESFGIMIKFIQVQRTQQLSQ